MCSAMFTGCVPSHCLDGLITLRSVPQSAPSENPSLRIWGQPFANLLRDLTNAWVAPTPTEQRNHLQTFLVSIPTVSLSISMGNNKYVTFSMTYTVISMGSNRISCECKCNASGSCEDRIRYAVLDQVRWVMTHTKKKGKQRTKPEEIALKEDEAKSMEGSVMIRTSYPRCIMGKGHWWSLNMIVLRHLQCIQYQIQLWDLLLDYIWVGLLDKSCISCKGDMDSMSSLLMCNLDDKALFCRM